MRLQSVLARKVCAQICVGALACKFIWRFQVCGWDFFYFFFLYKSIYLCPCKHAEAEYSCLPHVASCPHCFFPPISISDLAIPVPTLCECTAGPCCPVSLIAAWWTAINPWWRGWGIFMSACQQWHDTLWGWIICLPYTGSDCWVQFTAKWCVCLCVCVYMCVCSLVCVPADTFTMCVLVCAQYVVCGFRGIVIPWGEQREMSSTSLTDIWQTSCSPQRSVSLLFTLCTAWNLLLLLCICFLSLSYITLHFENLKSSC